MEVISLPFHVSFHYSGTLHIPIPYSNSVTYSGTILLAEWNGVHSVLRHETTKMSKFDPLGNTMNTK